MNKKVIPKLSRKKRYLQIALNGTLEDAQKIIAKIPISDRIIIEAGTPLIKRYGEEGIKKIKNWYSQKIFWNTTEYLQKEKQINISGNPLISFVVQKATEKYQQAKYQKLENQNNISNNSQNIIPYVVADLKMMDRGETEVEMAKRAGADGVVALGHSPIESLNAFIQKCEELKMDAMIDMMNVEYPLSILRQLKKMPQVVMLHRGVDEEKFNKEKQIPLHEIRRIKSNYDILISIAGGDTLREAQRAIFNDADIVVVWKSFFQQAEDTADLAKQFLKEIR